MPGSYTTRWYEHHELRKIAQDFREQYGVASSEVPCPIERIIERDLDIFVQPIDGVFRRTGGVSAFLSADRTTIYIDEDALWNRPETYQYALAHEAGHLVLHTELWDTADFTSPETYIEWRTGIGAGVFTSVEWQADTFASHVLVPGNQLRPCFQDEATKAIDLLVAGAPGIVHRESQAAFDICLRHVCESVASEFVVAPITVHVRADYDGLTDELADSIFGPNHAVQTRRRFPRFP